MSLSPLPPLASAAFSGGAPGALSQIWSQYISSLDALIRASAVGGAGLQPLPQPSAAVIVPTTGSPTPPWRLYWNSRDVVLRASGWTLNGVAARSALKPLPPTVGFAMVFAPSGVLAQPWAQYFASIDALARPQA